MQLTREKQFNAINYDMLSEMSRIMNDCSDEWLLTRGTKKVFSSGVDLFMYYEDHAKRMERM